jgi:hypothetical protein
MRRVDARVFVPKTLSPNVGCPATFQMHRQETKMVYSYFGFAMAEQVR